MQEAGCYGIHEDANDSMRRSNYMAGMAITKQTQAHVCLVMGMADFEVYGQLSMETRGQWPYRPPATRAMRNRHVVLYDLN